MPRPVNGQLTQGFGPTDEPLDGPYNGYAHFNKGYDYGAPVGTPAQAVVGGTVIAAGSLGDGWGISVKVRDANGYTHNYGHLSAANVKVGDSITPGQVVGLTGNTGNSTGPHLSYDVWDSSGKFIDPGQFVGGGSNVGNSSSSAAGSSSDMSDYQDFLDTYVGPRPKLEDFHGSGTGDYAITPQQQYDEAIKTYNTAVKSATAGYASYRTAIGKGVRSPDQKAQDAIKNMIDLLDAQVRAGTLDASVAATKLTAFANEQKSALDLGQQQLTANAEMDKYGPGGDWSYNDIGGPFSDYAKRNGIDPTTSALRFTTPKPFDPVAAYLQNSQLMGAGAGPPGAPSPGIASQNIAALIAGASSGGGGNTIPPITPPSSDGGGFPSWGTGPSGPYMGATITPPQLDQNGNPVHPPPPIELGDARAALNR